MNRLLNASVAGIALSAMVFGSELLERAPAPVHVTVQMIYDAQRTIEELRAKLDRLHAKQQSLQRDIATSEQGQLGAAAADDSNGQPRSDRGQSAGGTEKAD